jgi:uncharacterized protein involved in exopolysaccharide biosynthesis
VPGVSLRKLMVPPVRRINIVAPDKVNDLLDRRLSTHVKDMRADLMLQQKGIERRVDSALAEMQEYLQSLHSEISQFVTKRVKDKKVQSKRIETIETEMAQMKSLNI